LIERGTWPLRETFSTFYLEFCFDAYVYKLNQTEKLSLNHIFYLGISALLLVSAEAFNIFFANYELLRAATYGVAAMLILMICLAIQNYGHKANKILVAIGDSSYSLYLLHPLLLAIIFWLNLIFPSALKIAAIPLLLVILGISYMWFTCVENKIHKAAKKIIYAAASNPERNTAG
jgi:peptidoglycan/LPS O-acetylase OafA/YrhL